MDAWRIEVGCREGVPDPAGEAARSALLGAGLRQGFSAGGGVLSVVIGLVVAGIAGLKLAANDVPIG